MKKTLIPLILSATLLCISMILSAPTEAFEILPKKQFNALLFTKTEGWHHKSIPAGVEAFKRLSELHHFNLVWHEESRYFNDKFLKQFDAVIFLSTTGDVLEQEEKAALKRFIQSGKGFVGVHSASDTEHQWPWFLKLVGREFMIHPEVQTAELNIVQQDFAGLSQLPKKVLWTDEWYDFGPEISPNLNYLLTVDEKTYNPSADWGQKKGEGMGAFHPIAWYQHYDGGRSFYTALGHMSASYKAPYFLTHLYGGLYWAATGKGSQ